MDDNTQYLEMFFEETDDHLQRLNELVLDLESDPSDLELLNDIFRSAHTLKGMAATMGFVTMTEVTHHLENVFSLLKEQKITADEDVITLVFKSLDALSEIVEDIRQGRNEVRDYSEVIELCDRVASRADDSQTEGPKEKQAVNTPAKMETLDSSDYDVARKAKETGYHAYTIAVQIEKESVMVNARVFLVFNKLEEYGEVLKTEPAMEVLEAEEFGHFFQCLFLTELEQAEVQQMLEEISEIESVRVEKLEEPVAETEQAKPVEVETKKAEGNTQNTQSHNQSIRVDIGKLDSFMNLVSELVIYRTQLEDIGQKTQNKKLTETLTYVSRITEQLQTLVLNIRMQPLHTVTSRFPRLVRDLSNDTGKPMELVIEGDETELDRTIVAELSEPLIHLIRNSADHGIESSDVRESLGKAPKGTIKISAYQEGNRVFITVSDDGKGLDAEAIRQSAERKGIVTEGLTSQEIQELIFHPGFSTASTVTKISGRGVGMDVVKTKIEELGGSIDIKSTPHVGTSFRLSLPLTLSIIPALLVQVENHVFALPLSVIDHVIHTQKEDIKQTHHGEVLMNRGKAVPVIRLEDQLGMTGDTMHSTHMVLVTIDGKEYALSVDSIIGQQEIVIKELGPEFKSMNDYLGAAIMGDGSIVLILNVTAICMERNQVAYV